MHAGKPTLMGLVLLSSILLPFALPNEILPGGSPVIGLACIAPVFIAVTLAPSFGFASLMGVVFGAVSTGLANFWLMFFQDYTVWTFGGVVLGYIGYNSLLFPFLRGFARLKPRYRPLIIATAWAFYEYLKSIGFLGYPYGLVAYPVGDILPVIQFVDVTGVWGLSFLMAFVNALVAEGVLLAYRAAPPWNDLSDRIGAPGAGKGVISAAWSSMFFRQAVFGVFLVALVLGYGACRLSTPIPRGATADMLLVQQNINPWSAAGAVRQSTRINIDLTEKALLTSAPDLIVWSEASVPDIWCERIDGVLRLSPKNNVLIPYAKRSGAYTLFGGVEAVDRGRQVMNSAALLSPEGNLLDSYGKMHLVPFAEGIPFFELPAVKWFFGHVVHVWNPWTAGNRYTVFHAPLRNGGSVSFGVPICFEDAFADLCRGFIVRGADILINITNVAWSGTNSAETQQFTAAKFRAVENRRTLVRSTNTGVTAVVDPWGRVSGTLPLFTRGTIDVEVPLYREKSVTAYTLLGDYFPWCLGIALLVLLFLGLGKERQ
jgi:apolipoprotein N-acyltransferase